MGVSDIKTTKPFDKNNPNKVTGVRATQREANGRDAIKTGTKRDRDHINFYDRIDGITDDMFETKTIVAGSFKRDVLAIKEEHYDPVIRFMCLPSSSLIELINAMLNNAFQNKDIQLLAKFGIIKEKLEKFYAYCCLENYDIFERTMRILNNNVFTIEEVMKNLELKKPVPFFVKGIEVEGLTFEQRSSTANLPTEILDLEPDKIRLYVTTRFSGLIKLTRADYNIRYEKSKEEYGNDDSSEKFDRPARYILD